LIFIIFQVILINLLINKQLSTTIYTADSNTDIRVYLVKEAAGYVDHHVKKGSIFGLMSTAQLEPESGYYSKFDTSPVLLTVGT
jgi:hypothetical protein